MSDQPKTKPINEEVAQSKLRLGLIGTFASIVLFQSFRGGYEDGRFNGPLLIMLGYLICAVPWLIWVKRTPEQHKWRRNIAITADLGLAVLGMHLLGEAGAWIYPAYLWIIIGNGLRFGSKILASATGIGGIAFGGLILLNPEWQAMGSAAWGMWAGRIFIPLMFLKLLGRIHALSADLGVELAENGREAVNR
jgi:hypothetical protein